jgi:YbbR domain-containing protein
MAFRDYILDRFWLKLFSFILATLIWFTVSSNIRPDFRGITGILGTGPTREITRPVRVVTMPTTRRFFKIEPVEVRITLAGNAAVLDQLNLNNIHPYVNLTDALDSAATYEVKVEIPPGKIRVVEVVPSMVMVEPQRPN